jgi:DNA polymerase III sliding clamp (beta) subunit (PCNA family)
LNGDENLMGELEELIKEQKTVEEKTEEDLEIIGEKEETKKKPEKKQKEETNPELKIKLDCPNTLWNTLTRRLDGIKEEFILQMNKEGFRVEQVDEGNVIMIDLKIPKSAFNEYSVSHNIKIGVDTQRLKKHLKIFPKDITTTNGQNQLLFKGENGQQSKMGLVKISDLDMELPEIKYDVELKTPAKAIQKMISVGEEFGKEELIFSVKEKLFYILVMGETDEVRFPICKINSLSDIKDFKSIYSIEYLKTIMKFKDKDEIIVRFGKDTPINVTFDDKNEKVSFIVAPRIESD